MQSLIHHINSGVNKDWTHKDKDQIFKDKDQIYKNKDLTYKDLKMRLHLPITGPAVRTMSKTINHNIHYM